MLKISEFIKDTVDVVATASRFLPQCDCYGRPFNFSFTRETLGETIYLTVTGVMCSKCEKPYVTEPALSPEHKSD